MFANLITSEWLRVLWQRQIFSIPQLKLFSHLTIVGFLFLVLRQEIV
jgi:hypothetical protein